MKFVGSFKDLKVGDEVVFQMQTWTVTIAHKDEVELEAEISDREWVWITVDRKNPMWERKVQINR